MEGLGIINFYTYLMGVIMIVLLPGPNSLYVLSVATQKGNKAGWHAALGVFFGDSILMLATALGIGQILYLYPNVFDSIKYLGAVYLAYIGIKLIWGACCQFFSKNDSVKKTRIKRLSQKKRSNTAYFKKALVLSLLNPKAIFFFLAFFVQFVDVNYEMPVISFFVLAITLQIISMLYLGGLIYFGSRFSELFNHQKYIQLFCSIMIGGVFLFFSSRLLVDN